MSASAVAILECVNPDCTFPQGGQSEIPEIDPESLFSRAQTDWPICDTCLEPLTLEDVVGVDEGFLLALAQEAFELYAVEGLKRLRVLCRRMIDAEKAGEGRTKSSECQGIRLPFPGKSTLH